MLCELHHPILHGKTEDSDPNIETHYLVYNRYNPETGISFIHLEEYEELDTDDEYSSDEDTDDIGLRNIDNEILLLKEVYSDPSMSDANHFDVHPTIRNYYNIVSKPNYIKPEIGEYIILPTQEAVAILKTFWLRIIQKKWKKVFQERKNIITNDFHVNSIIHKKDYFPEYLPSLKGMLHNLKNNY
jgi:hypothetical protein